MIGLNYPKMALKNFINLCLMVILGLLFTSFSLKVKNTRPNIVVVLVDDMRWDEYGKAGHPYLKTPNIDWLVSQGVSFDNAFATTPLCSPSRANFLTGQYAHTNGIVDNTSRNEQSHRLKTFPLALHQSGYETAFIGKWHMGNDDTPRPGFDRWVSLKGQGEAVDPSLNIDGTQKKVQGYVSDILTDYSLEFIAKKRKNPFMLYLSHKALHPNMQQHDDGSIIEIAGGGFIPAARHDGEYANKVFAKRPNFGVTPTDKPALMRKIGNLPLLSENTATDEPTIQKRSEMLLAIDESLGKIIKSLTKINQLNNTIIVFTSDHGYFYGEHGLSEERRLAYEETIRIPLIIHYPKIISKNTRLDPMVLSIDLAPTLLQMADLTPSKDIEGTSFLPLLKGSKNHWRSSFLIEYNSDTVFPRMLNMGYKAVRTTQYKYIQYTELKNMDELYDLYSDPYEMQNIISKPEAASILKDMKRDLNLLLNK